LGNSNQRRTANVQNLAKANLESILEVNYSICINPMPTETPKSNNTNNSEKYSSYINTDIKSEALIKPKPMEIFSDYIDLNGSESLVTPAKSAAEKARDYAEFEKEITSLGIDKKTVLEAIKNVQKPGDLSKNVSEMLEVLMLGLGEKIYELGFESEEYMYKIVSIIQNSEVLSQKIINECQKQIWSEHENKIKTKQYQELVNHLPLIEGTAGVVDIENIGLDEAITQLQSEYRTGYDTLISTLKTQHSKSEIDKSINEVRSILNDNRDSIGFFKRLEVISKSELGVIRKLILGILDLQDARVYFDFNDKKELDNFLSQGLKI
jgi:hypothetical protein